MSASREWQLNLPEDHGLDCWRKPEHHDCAVQLIERANYFLAPENDWFPLSEVWFVSARTPRVRR